MARLKKNPFQPGAGWFPPERVGHDEAATYLATGLKAILRKGGGDMVVLYGPRGNGKTALLGELREKAKAADVRVIALKPSEMVGGSVTLPRLLAAEMAKALPKVKEAKANIGGFGAGVKLDDPDEPAAGIALRRCIDEQLLLMVDEAHEMPVGLGKVLLEVAQDCVNERLPLFVVLAGTPGLPAHLKQTHASFWERCTRFRIGRLETDEAVREALAKPAKDSGMPIDADALEKLAEESLRYPFFVQKLGFESWNAAHARGGTRRITLKDVHKGTAAMKRDLQTFYSDRRREAGERSVLAEAEAVSRMVVAKGRDALLTTAELVEAVQSAAVANDRDPGESWVRLVHLGLVWEPSEPDLWEPGIPSLCRYIVDKVGVPVPPSPNT